MAMTRGTPLVATVAAVVKLTGQQYLGNIPNAAAELTMTDLLTTASDYIYDKLERNGIDPTGLTNQAVYERAVAFHFLAILAEAGLLTVEGESALESSQRYERRSLMYFEEVKPKSSSDMPRAGSENVPRIGNVFRYANFTEDDHYNDIQRVL